MRDRSIKPIETHYKNWRCRSRLEARWCLFFELLGIEFEYEKEGFLLDGKVRYVPDFFLPHVDMWAEVKPDTFTEEESGKCGLLARRTLKSCLLLPGLPALVEYEVIQPYEFGDGTTESLSWGCSLDIDFQSRIYYQDEHRFFSFPNYSVPPDKRDFSWRYIEAVDIARSHRFDWRVTS